MVDKTNSYALKDVEEFDSKTIYRRILEYLWGHKTLFIIAVVFLLILSLIQVGVAAIEQLLAISPLTPCIKLGV